jgi:hypothetical protein
MSSSMIGGRLLADTGTIRTFPDSNTPDHYLRSAFMVFGHFTLLVLAVAGITASTVGSAIGVEGLWTSRLAIYFAWVFAVCVGLGVVRTSFRFAGYALAYAAGIAASMGFGHIVFEDAMYFGWVFAGLTAMLVFVAGVIRLDVQPISIDTVV